MPHSSLQGSAPDTASKDGSRAVSCALIAREQELKLLDDVLERAVSYQAPQLVTIIGNQGVGKSRLLAEWLASITAPSAVPAGNGGGKGAARPAVRVLRAQAAAGSGSYSLIQRLLRDRFGVVEVDDREAVSEKVRQQLEQVFGDKRLAEVMHFIGRFLDVTQRASPLTRALEVDPRHFEAIARTVLRRVFELDATRMPLVFAVDDLHYADDDSLGLLAEVAEALGGSPVLIVAAARPDLLVRYPRWGTGTDHTRVDLGPLPRPAAETMLRQLLVRAGNVPRSLVEDACEMTSGNPFFLEELVRLFIAEGVIRKADAGEGMGGAERWQIDLARARRIKLPVTVEEAIQARIGSLSVEERDLLEKAATFGNVFWVGALVCLRRLDQGDAPARTLDDTQRKAIDALLVELVQRDYLLRMPDSSIPGESDEYVFKHNLERELVTKMTAPDRARRHHLFGAQWLETRLGAPSKERASASRGDVSAVWPVPKDPLREEQLEFLAALYERGGHGRRAAELWFAAGDSARARYANAAASDFYGRGLKLVERDDALARLDALHNLGDVTALVGRTREALALFEEMLRAAWLLDHPAKAGAAHGRIGRCYRTLGEYDRAEHHLLLAHDLFLRAKDERGVAGAEDDLGKVSYLRGDYQSAEERHAGALERRRKIGDKRSIALTVHNLALVAHAAGNQTEGLARFEEALGLRRAIGDRAGVSQSLMEMGVMWRDHGDLARALGAWEEALLLSKEVGDRVLEAQLSTRIGETLARSWRSDEAIAVLRQAAELAGELGDRLVQAEAARLLGETLLGVGQLAAAREQCLLSLNLVDKIGSRAHRGMAHRAFGMVLAKAENEGDRTEADTHFRTAVELLSDTGAESELGRAYRTYGDYLAVRGDLDGAQTVRERADEILGRLRENDGVPIEIDPIDVELDS